MGAHVGRRFRLKVSLYTIFEKKGLFLASPTPSQFFFLGKPLPRKNDIRTIFFFLAFFSNNIVFPHRAFRPFTSEEEERGIKREREREKDSEKERKKPYAVEKHKKNSTLNVNKASTSCTLATAARQVGKYRSFRCNKRK